jgi:hypothetical protein
MIRARQSSPDIVKYERAKAERANLIVSLAVSDPELMTQALAGLEAADRGISLLWKDFIHWEETRPQHEA